MITPLPGQSIQHVSRRFACHVCGYARDWHPPTHNHDPKLGRRFFHWEDRHASSMDVTDQWFGASLWLQTPCCGQVLWAGNASHLTYLRGYVAASLWEGFIDQASTGSSLPDWMITAKHRDEVLRGLDRLGAQLVGTR